MQNQIILFLEQTKMFSSVRCALDQLVEVLVLRETSGSGLLICSSKELNPVILPVSHSYSSIGHYSHPLRTFKLILLIPPSPKH